MTGVCGPAARGNADAGAANDLSVAAEGRQSDFLEGVGVTIHVRKERCLRAGCALPGTREVAGEASVVPDGPLHQLVAVSIPSGRPRNGLVGVVLPRSGNLIVNQH
jgi:hypothetical protein